MIEARVNALLIIWRKYSVACLAILPVCSGFSGQGGGHRIGDSTPTIHQGLRESPLHCYQGRSLTNGYNILVIVYLISFFVVFCFLTQTVEQNKYHSSWDLGTILSLPRQIIRHEMLPDATVLIVTSLSMRSFFCNKKSSAFLDKTHQRFKVINNQKPWFMIYQ